MQIVSINTLVKKYRFKICKSIMRSKKRDGGDVGAIKIIIQVPYRIYNIFIGEFNLSKTFKI